MQCRMQIHIDIVFHITSWCITQVAMQIQLTVQGCNTLKVKQLLTSFRNFPQPPCQLSTPPWKHGLQPCVQAWLPMDGQMEGFSCTFTRNGIPRQIHNLIALQEVQVVFEPVCVKRCSNGFTRPLPVMFNFLLLSNAKNLTLMLNIIPIIIAIIMLQFIQKFISSNALCSNFFFWHS